jgi:hypothetical protein
MLLERRRFLAMNALFDDARSASLCDQSGGDIANAVSCHRDAERHPDVNMTARRCYSLDRCSLTNARGMISRGKAATADVPA